MKKPTTKSSNLYTTTVVSRITLSLLCLVASMSYSGAANLDLGTFDTTTEINAAGGGFQNHISWGKMTQSDAFDTNVWDSAQDNTGNGGGSCKITVNFANGNGYGDALRLYGVVQGTPYYDSLPSALTNFIATNYVSVDFDVKWDTNNSTTSLQYFNSPSGGGSSGIQINLITTNYRNSYTWYQLGPYVVLPNAASNGWAHVSMPITNTTAVISTPAQGISFYKYISPTTIAAGGIANFWIDNVTFKATAAGASTGFNQVNAGPWDYNTTANWAGGTINGIWDTSLTLATAQTVTFAADTTLSTGLSFNYAGNFGLTVDSSSTTTRTLTLGGDLTLNTGGGTSANVIIGDAVNHLNVSLGNSNRNLNVATNRTLTFLDVISSSGTSGGITLTNTTSAGTVILSGANTYTGPTVIRAGNTLTVNGTGTLGGAGGLTVGGNGNGSVQATFNYYSSGASTVGQLLVGAGGGSCPPGVMNMTNGTITANPFLMSNSKDSVSFLNLSGGTLNVSGSGAYASIGSRGTTVNGSLATINVTGGFLNVAGPLLIGAYSSGAASQGIVNQSGGTVTANSVQLAAASADANNHVGTYNLNGGTLSTAYINGYVNSSTGTNFSTNNFAGGTLKPTGSTTTFVQGLTACNVQNGGAIIDTAGYNVTISNALLHYAGATTDTLTKLGSGTLTLAGTNTYASGTTISNGTLALSGNGSISNSPIIGIANGAIFNISGLTTTFSLAGGQTLTNLGVGAIINGTNSTGFGTVSLLYDGVNPSFIVTNGGMTLSSSTTFKINNTGSKLTPGGYLIISNITAGTTGLVAGTMPSVTLGGNGGPSAGTPALSPTSAGLWLTVGGNSSVTYGGQTTFTYNGTAQTPGITSITGSTGARTTNYVGIGSTVYSSVNPPTNAGTYYVSNTVASDSNYFGTTNSQAFTIGQSGSTISYGGGTSFIYNGTAQTPTITSFSGSTGARSTNYVGIGSTSYSSAAAPMNAGTYALTNTLLSDLNFAGATNGVTFTIAQTNMTIAARSNTKTYDGSASATNSPTISAGSLQGSDTATLTEAYADASVGMGKTLIPSIAITNAGVDVVANYNVTPLDDTTGVINPSQATTTLLLTNSVGVTNYYGQMLVFSAVVQTNGVTPANASSNVVFSLGSTPVWTNVVVGGLAYYTNDDLTVGTTNFTAQYLGDNNYLGSSVTATQTVLQATPTLTLTASGISYGQTLGSSSLSGSVATNGYDVDADGDEAVAGSFAFANSSIAPNAGVTNVWVIFTPTDTTNYTTASNTVVVTVNKANSTVTVTGTSSFTYDGAGQGPASASVTGSGGAVSYSYSGTGYGPSANTPTNAGSYMVTATVVADDNYNSATSSPTAFSISPAPASVTADAKTKTYGTVNPTLTATVVGQVIGGDTINYSLSVDAGQYSHVGVSNILVTLGSNPNYNLSATNGTLTIYKANTFVGASSTENPSGYKDAVAYIATLPADATGSVVFSSTNGPISTNSVSSGSATSLFITNLPRGTNVITVAYLGNGNYLGSTTNLAQIVTNHPPVANVMTVTRTAGLALIIKLSDIATNWIDVDGDTVELTSVNMQSTNGVNLFPLNWSTNLDGSIVTANAYAYIGYTNSPNVNDQINYGISDGQGGTNIGYLNIVIQGSVTGTNSITTYNFTNPTSNTVTAYGIPYFYYILERSTNLSSPVWVDVQTNQAAPNGLINMTDQFIDLGGVKPSPAFYQLKWQP